MIQCEVLVLELTTEISKYTVTFFAIDPCGYRCFEQGKNPLQESNTVVSIRIYQLTWRHIPEVSNLHMPFNSCK